MSEQITSYCGFIAVVGRSNVGKSTLINNLVGKKVSIIADRPQTTRRKILGIKTIGAHQAIYVDTPGITLNTTSVLNRSMNKAARTAMKAVDLILFVVEGSNWQTADQLVFGNIKKLRNPPPVILVINKLDLVSDPKILLPAVAKFTEQYTFTEIIPISASKKQNLTLLEKQIFKLLPPSPHYFAKEQVTDQDLNFQLAEVIREKLIKNVKQELPYVTDVNIINITKSPKLTKLEATIWVEKVGQKKIIIGANGSKLRSIGTQAREELEKFLQTKVFLGLYVKVRSAWSDDPKIVAQKY